MSGYCGRCGNTECLCYLEYKEECVCGETSSRNCPVHQHIGNMETDFTDIESIKRFTDEIDRLDELNQQLSQMCDYRDLEISNLRVRNDELETTIDDLLDVLEVNQKHHPTQTKAELIAKYRTTCKDCGTETKRGKGSARCPSCWEDRCGYSTDNEE